MSQMRCILSLTILSLALGCGPDPNSGFHRHPDPEMAVRTPAMPKVDSGDVSEGTIEITNYGDGKLVVASLKIREEGEDDIQEVFARGQAWNGRHTLEAGESLELSVLYAPANSIQDRAWLLVDHNDYESGREAWEIPLPQRF